MPVANLVIKTWGFLRMLSNEAGVCRSWGLKIFQRVFNIFSNWVYEFENGFTKRVTKTLQKIYKNRIQFRNLFVIFRNIFVNIL